MTIKRVMGIETEYGIVGGNASSVVRAYDSGATHENLAATNESAVEGMTDIGGHVGGDYGSVQEQVRSTRSKGIVRTMIRSGANALSHLAGTAGFHHAGSILQNGARFYVDMGHPEYCTPETANPRDLVVADKAGERIVHTGAQNARGKIKIYKNNSDGQGNSFGCHENYLIERRSSEAFGTELTEGLLPYFATRIIFTGSGKIGVETESETNSAFRYHGEALGRRPSYERSIERALEAVDRMGAHFLDMPEFSDITALIQDFAERRREAGEQELFQLSQRADFMTCKIGLQTTHNRPIMNTRDEPHADRAKYMRLHVINGDANMCDVATYLKAGTASLVLDLIEDGIVPDLALRDPIRSMKDVSRDLSRTWSVTHADGTESTAIEIQRKYLEAAAEAYAGRDSMTDDILARWNATLSALETDPMQLVGQVDWVTKLYLTSHLMNKHGVGMMDPKIRTAALQYHDVDPAESLFAFLDAKGIIERLSTTEEIAHAMTNPPRDTRAYLRGNATRLDCVRSVDWGGFTIKSSPNLQVKLNEPYSGTAEEMEGLFEKDIPGKDLAEILEGVDGITIGTFAKKHTTVARHTSPRAYTGSLWDEEDEEPETHPSQWMSEEELDYYGRFYGGDLPVSRSHLIADDDDRSSSRSKEDARSEESIPADTDTESGVPETDGEEA